MNLSNETAQTHIDPQTLGKRLQELRMDLAHSRQEKWSQKDLAKALDVNQAIISRLERGLGSYDNLLKLLHFYHQAGFNLAWILISQNASLSKLRPLVVSEDITKKQVELQLALNHIYEIVFGTSAPPEHLPAQQA